MPFLSSSVKTALANSTLTVIGCLIRLPPGTHSGSDGRLTICVRLCKHALGARCVCASVDLSEKFEHAPKVARLDCTRQCLGLDDNG